MSAAAYDPMQAGEGARATTIIFGVAWQSANRQRLLAKQEFCIQESR